MKFTSENLMKAMGLQIGDIIKINNKIYTITKSEECQGDWIGYSNETDWHNISNLINGNEYEIIPKTKRVGDLKCEDCECIECHLRCLPHCNQLDSAKKTLFNILDDWDEYYTFDQEIYDLLKARLDKEVTNE